MEAASTISKTSGDSRQLTLPGFYHRLIKTAIETLQFYAPKEGKYWGAFSGGKDSCVIKRLAEMAKVPVEWHYNVTTIDPPELVWFIKREHPDVNFSRPPCNFFTMMAIKGYPTRAGRWCCEHFKESKSPEGAIVLLGVRTAESPKRARNWQVYMPHFGKQGAILNPILHWRDADVWQFIREQELPYCELYDEGWARLGCIGCPMARQAQRDREFIRWPRYEKLWRRAFHKLWGRKAGTKQRDGREWFGSAKFASADELFDWWKSDEPLPTEECQGTLELFA